MDFYYIYFFIFHIFFLEIIYFNVHFFSLDPSQLHNECNKYVCNIFNWIFNNLTNIQQPAKLKSCTTSICSGEFFHLYYRIYAIQFLLLHILVCSVGMVLKNKHIYDFSSCFSSIHRLHHQLKSFSYFTLPPSTHTIWIWSKRKTKYLLRLSFCFAYSYMYLAYILLA